MNLWFRTIAGMLSGMRNKLRAERRFAFDSRGLKPRIDGRGQVQCDRRDICRTFYYWRRPMARRDLTMKCDRRRENEFVAFVGAKTMRDRDGCI